MKSFNDRLQDTFYNQVSDLNEKIVNNLCAQIEALLWSESYNRLKVLEKLYIAIEYAKTPSEKKDGDFNF